MMSFDFDLELTVVKTAYMHAIVASYVVSTYHYFVAVYRYYRHGACLTTVMWPSCLCNNQHMLVAGSWKLVNNNYYTGSWMLCMFRKHDYSRG